MTEVLVNLLNSSSSTSHFTDELWVFQLMKHHAVLQWIQTFQSANPEDANSIFLGAIRMHLRGCKLWHSHIPDEHSVKHWML
jgi:hypothetical protein